MDWYWWVILGLGIALLFTLVYTLLFQHQIKNLLKQMQQIIDEDTNILLTTQAPFHDSDHLADEINSLIGKYKHTLRKVERSNRNFKEIITNISHDLRTPLTSAIGYMQMVESNSLSEPEKQEYLQLVHQRMITVRTMLEQLFELARIESDELVLQSDCINVNNVLRDTISLFYDDFLQKKITPTVSIPETAYTIIGDADALKRVFQNIIHNALVHGENDFSLTVKAKNHRCKMSFSNHTKLLDYSDIPYIFDRFYTADHSRSRKTTGLGLSISKRLVERMSGSIDADYKDELFSITVSFPLVTDNPTRR